MRPSWPTTARFGTPAWWEAKHTTDEVLVARTRELASRAREHRDGVGIVLLARAFHVLDNADGLDSSYPEKLYAFGSASDSEATRDAVRFVRNDDCIPYLDEASESKLGAFNVVEAMARWDFANRAPFVT